MDLSQFEDNLDRYGGNLFDWPADARADASALLARSETARTILRTLGEIEAVLRVPAVGDLDASLAAQAMAARATRLRQIRLVPPAVRRAAWASAAAAALVLGLFVGDLGPPHRDDSPSNVMAAAFDTSGGFDVD